MNEHAGHRSRLRENFIQNGIEGMADHQVLELLLTYALPRVDVNPLAHRLLSRFGSLEGVLSARPDQLRQVEGIGESAAVFLSLLGQVDRRVLLQRLAGHDKRPVLATPSGSLTEVLADPRPILETALIHKACFIALAHNHPSGDLTPSREDQAAAQRIEAAAEAVGIGVADQFVLGRGAVYSLRTDRVLLFSTPDLVTDMTLNEYARRG